MNATIRRFVERYFPSIKHKQYKMLLIGLDASGKTSILYTIKTGEVVTTIPTIGFNVETVDASLPLGNARRSVEAMCWDVGGCDRLRDMPKFFTPFIAGTDALLWAIDSHDRERLAESIEELEANVKLLEQLDTERKRKPPILIIATKQDFPLAIPVAELEERVKKATEGHVGEALYDGFEWLLAELESKPSPSQPTSENNTSVAPLPLSALPDPRAPELLEKTLSSWVDRADAEAEEDSEKFLQQFHDIALPSWDHYTHIRLAYVILSIHGRQKGKNMIFDGIERYIKESPNTNTRKFHFTMTYFWIQMVHLGIERLRLASVSEKSSMSLGLDSDSASVATLTEEDPAKTFSQFLLTNPFLADGRLWADYYSTEVLMSEEARKGMVLPDKKALPNVVQSTA
ncbi:ADP-ribosylation factor [Mycena chlorophos]|uniref:ADP-ribosylation factor n=1 Tax=Mycena chlorophos TaxID=658473 RepID=A0A8H6W3K3_MYCCL|nr:ADP-ribosylation factor [Mycena chlorophos]